MMKGILDCSLSSEMDLNPVTADCLPLALSSQDSLLSHEKSAEGEVAALRLTAKSQVSLHRLRVSSILCLRALMHSPFDVGFLYPQSPSRDLSSNSKRLMDSVGNTFCLLIGTSLLHLHCLSKAGGPHFSPLPRYANFCIWSCGKLF